MWGLRLRWARVDTRLRTRKTLEDINGAGEAGEPQNNNAEGVVSTSIEEAAPDRMWEEAAQGCTTGTTWCAFAHGSKSVKILKGLVPGTLRGIGNPKFCNHIWMDFALAIHFGHRRPREPKPRLGGHHQTKVACWMWTAMSHRRPRHGVIPQLETLAHRMGVLGADDGCSRSRPSPESEHREQIPTGLVPPTYLQPDQDDEVLCVP